MVAVALADWPEDLGANAHHSRVTEAFFSNSADPADANQNASISAGVLAALAIPYGLMTRGEHKRRQGRRPGPASGSRTKGSSDMSIEHKDERANA